MFQFPQVGRVGPAGVGPALGVISITYRPAWVDVTDRIRVASSRIRLLTGQPPVRWAPAVREIRG
jgi:hypothetical protein